MRFCIGEFALITGLNFGPYPKNESPHSTRLVSTYLNDTSIVNTYALQATSAICTNKEDSWKLGLVCFIDSVLYSHEFNFKMDMLLFSLVESGEDLFNFCFGRESLEKTLSSSKQGYGPLPRTHYKK